MSSETASTLVKKGFFLYDHAILEKKFIQELQKYRKSGNQPSMNKICRRVGVCNRYIYNLTKNYPWAKKIQDDYDNLQQSWAENGGGLVDKAKDSIKTIKKEGERPSLKYIAKTMGISYDKLLKQAYPWQKKIRKLADKADTQWQKNGGKESKTVKKILAKWIKEEKTIHMIDICKEAGYPYGSLLNDNYEWQRVLYKELQNAKKAQILKQKEPARLEAEAKAIEELHLKPLNLVVYNIKELFERFIVEGVEIDEYRNVGVNLGMKKPVALAKLMYGISKGVLTNVKVDFDSFNPKRKTLIDGCIKAMKSYSSIHSSLDFFRNINTSLTDCYESKGTLPLPLNIDDSKVYYREYTFKLFQRFNKKQTNTHRQVQSKIKTLLAYMYSKEHYKFIIKGVPDIPTSKTAHTNVEIDEATHALSFYLSIFNQVADFIIDKHIAPYPISFNGIRMLIAPFQRLNILHENRTWKSNGSEHNIDKYYDFDAIQLRKIDDIVFNKEDFQEAGYKATHSHNAEKLEALNYAIQNETLNQTKTSLIELSINAFFMVFCGLSSHTDATLSNAEWEGDDEFEINKVGYRIRTIKPRAGYRRFSFPISIHLKSLLRKYLILRRMLLNGEESNLLFPFNINDSDRTYRVFSAIYPKLPRVGTRQLRQLYNRVTLTKSGGDLILTSQIIGNMPSTNDRHYNDSPQSIINHQLSSFTESMISVMRNEKEIETKHASCVKGGRDAVSVIDDKVKLNCENIFHCFICKHFRTHPVEEDIHKLMSFLFAMKFYLVGRAKDNPEFIEKIIEPTSKIIKTILGHMADKYDAEILIDEVFKRVFLHGELSDDWDKFFTLQKQLGAI